MVPSRDFKFDFPWLLKVFCICHDLLNIFYGKKCQWHSIRFKIYFLCWLRKFVFVHICLNILGAKSACGRIYMNLLYVLVMFWWCFSCVIRAVLWLFQRCFKDVVGMFEWCFRYDLGMFWKVFRYVLRMCLGWCFRNV